MWVLKNVCAVRVHISCTVEDEKPVSSFSCKVSITSHLQLRRCCTTFVAVTSKASASLSQLMWPNISPYICLTGETSFRIWSSGVWVYSCKHQSSAGFMVQAEKKRLNNSTNGKRLNLHLGVWKKLSSSSHTGEIWGRRRWIGNRWRKKETQVDDIRIIRSGGNMHTTQGELFKRCKQGRQDKLGQTNDLNMIHFKCQMSLQVQLFCGYSRNVPTNGELLGCLCSRLNFFHGFIRH